MRFGLYVIVYIGDFLILQKKDESDEDHLGKIEAVLGRLETRGFRANLKEVLLHATRDGISWVSTYSRRNQTLSEEGRRNVTYVASEELPILNKDIIS